MRERSFLTRMGISAYEVQIQLNFGIPRANDSKIGGNKEQDIDVRIIAATNENLIQQSGFMDNLEKICTIDLNEFTFRPSHSRQDGWTWKNSPCNILERK